MGINGDNAWLAVVNVIAQVLVKSQGNGCIYILACGTWEQVAELFYPVRLILNRDEDKHFTLTFSDKDERFHLYIKNY